MTERKLKLAVTGLKGQVVHSIIERATKGIEIIAIGRPHLELTQRGAVISSLKHTKCDVIINAAAYTHVDKAESEKDLALRVNGEGAGHVARAASELGVPLIHLSTDYVFDGNLDRPYNESDEPSPLNVYGVSKLAGEENIRLLHKDHVILRTSWVYSPFGQNFVKTMLRLGLDLEEIRIVSDQIGSPTSALDIADAIIKISRRLVAEPSQDLFGTFHISGQGEASWADVAEFIFSLLSYHGRNLVKVRRILTKEYPTVAMRPTNSRLDNSKIELIYGIKLPAWQNSLKSCVERLIAEKV